jgi:mannose-6-phosphate isomerase-like protein (cupin superfamily)
MNQRAVGRVQGAVITALFGVVLVGCAALAGGASPVGPAGETHVSAADLREYVAHGKDGLATWNVPTGGVAPVIMVRRDTDGEVELHEVMNDVFVAQGGRATILIGGRAEGQRETAPTEWRGGTISGAREYRVGPGDVLWIPAGLPHQVRVAKGDSFSYLAIKIANPPR